MNRSIDDTGGAKPVISQQALAQLGGGQVAYMRPLNGSEVQSLFPDAPQLSAEHKLWALLSADGTPIMLADSREAVIANAYENQLHMVTVH
ncbi:hypothetical protein AB7M35_002133 [Amorphus suaedae]|jgi:hypothetical protein